jgi:hypothetical protein
MVYLGAWGKLIHKIHKKYVKSKILWHCPFVDSIVILLLGVSFLRTTMDVGQKLYLPICVALPMVRNGKT